VLDLAQQSGMYDATDDQAESALLIDQMKASERLINTYDIRIAAVLGAIPPDAAP
jgi:hypothetical protein